MKTKGRLCSAALLVALLFVSGRMMAGPEPQASPAAATVITRVDANPVGQQAVARLPNSVQNGMLTFHAENQPLRSIVEEIGAMANVAVIVSEGVGSERISIDFQRYPVDEALRQILRDDDALFFYGADRDNKGPASLKTLWVYPANQGPGIERFSLGAWQARTKQIEHALADTDPEVRARAADSLIRREGRQSVGAVLEALQDPGEKVRDMALYRGLSMGVPIPEDTLINLALNDESANVRFLALQALPVDPTLRWVAERAAHDSNQPVSSAAREILREYDVSVISNQHYPLR